MDTAAFLKLLAMAASAKQVGVPVTQEPRYALPEGALQHETDQGMSMYPTADNILKVQGKGSGLDALIPIIQKLMGDPGVLARYSAAKAADIGPQTPQDTIQVLRNIMQRDTGRTTK